MVSSEQLWAVPALGARPVDAMPDPFPVHHRSPPLTAHRSPLTRRGGFTLLELLVVLAIVALLAALVAPRIGGGEGAMFRAKVRETVAALNYARREAIINGRPAEATLLKQGGEVQGRPGLRVSRGAAVSVVEGAAAVGEGAFRVTFFPEGGSSGGEFTLTHERWRALIEVDQITGRITTTFPGESP